MKTTWLKAPYTITETAAKAACIGYFDGVHLGHQVLIQKTIAIARTKQSEATLITFDPDPWSVIHDSKDVKHITPLAEKLRLAEALGMDHVVILEFTKELSHLSPEAFIDTILGALNVQDLICGADFHFGYRGQGDVHLLQTYGATYFTTHIIEIGTQAGEKIGTTMITQAILSGNMAKAHEGLGRDYAITGIVVDGAKQGRTIGFPTANLDVEAEYLIPKPGIYAGYTEVKGQWYRSVLNIGTNPTFNTQTSLSIETFLLDFDQEIYGDIIRQSFVKRLRDELKFDSVDALVQQMHRDVATAKEILDEVN